VRGKVRFLKHEREKKKHPEIQNRVRYVRGGGEISVASRDWSKARKIAHGHAEIDRRD